MKIICESQKEYDDLNKTFRYLHDFAVEDRDGDMVFLDQNYKMVGDLVHMYLEGKDFPEKKKYMYIEPMNENVIKMEIK